MSRMFRQILSSLLIFSFTFQGQVVYAGNAPSRQNAFQLQQLLDNSKRMSPGQPRGSFPLDRYLLLEQEVKTRSYVGRSFSFFSNETERELEEHSSRADRIDGLRKKIHIFLNVHKAAGASIPESACASIEGDAVKKIAKENIQKNLVQYLNEGRKKDTPLFVWEVREYPSLLKCVDERLLEIQKDWRTQIEALTAQSEELAEVPNITEALATERQVWHNWWDLDVKVVPKQRDEILHQIKMQSSADHHAVNDANSYACAANETCEFDLSSKGETLHRIHGEITNITTFGPYVVFTHKDSYDAQSGVEHLFFMDLAAYGPSLGKTDIPVFRLPVVQDKPAQSLKVRNKQIIVDDKSSVPLEVFMAASEMEQAAYNISSNVVDPDALSELIPYVSSLGSYFTKVMEANLKDGASEAVGVQQATVLLKERAAQIQQQIEASVKLSQFMEGKEKPKEEDLEIVSDEMKQVLTTYGEGVQKSEVLNQRMTAVTQNLSSARGLKARVKMFLNKIMSPTPNASLKLKRALVMVGAQRDVNKGWFWNFMLDRPYLHSTLMAAGMMAAVSPESFVDLAEMGLALGNGIFDYTKFALYGFWEAGVSGTLATLAPVYDFSGSILKQYVYDGNWWRTMVGVSTYVPIMMSLYFLPHLIFNLNQIYKDSKKADWNGFVDHQERFVKEYYERLAADEAERRNLEKKDTEKNKVSFSEEEEREIQEWIRARKEISPAFKPPGYISRFWNGTKSSIKKLSEKVGLAKLFPDEGLWAAILNVTFSYPAMELTLTRWTQFWNWFAGARYSSIGFLTLRDLGLKYNFPIFLRAKPISIATRLRFPEFFGTVAGKRKKKVTIPTELNGGLRGWEKRDLTWLQEGIFGKPAEVKEAEQNVERELNKSELKSLSESFERSILETEDVVYKTAFQAALAHLPEVIGSQKELKKLFNDQPIKSVVEKRVRELPTKIRTFLRIVTEEVYLRTMSEYLTTTLGEDEVKERTLTNLKEEILSIRRQSKDLSEFKFDPKAAQQIALKYGANKDLLKHAAKQAERGELSISNWLLNRKYNLISDMDPEQNGSMERYSVVAERLKSPNALSRAVRAEISKLLITFPLDLAFKMVLTAAIFEGSFKPIQDQFWGENSIFYFSRDAFYMSSAVSFVLSMLADAWLKLQQDERQDKKGGFKNIPVGEDAAKSMFRWYAKQFGDKDNTLFSQWAFSNKLGFWNFPAALANMGVFYYLFSGRLDISLIFAGYAVSFGTPLSAFHMKIDQAFERSAEYAARGIKDEKWMAHPDIQAVISKEKQYYRNRFQLLNDMLGNIEGNWVGNIEVIPTSYGTRGFARALFGGSLLEETIVEKLLHPLNAAVDKVPVVGVAVQAISHACEHYLTNGNVDLRIKK